MLDIGLDEAAGRTAYLAAFNAAQALISEHTGRSAKTHKGVSSEFHRITAGHSRFDAELRAFLSSAYSLKSIADYEIGPGAFIPHEVAAAAISTGKRFVGVISAMLAG